MAGILWEEKCGPHTPDVSEVLNFLHKLFEKGLGYSSICNHRSALSAIVKVPGTPKLGDHLFISRFMKGIFNLKPPLPRYTKTWDVNILLKYLKALGSNNK